MISLESIATLICALPEPIFVLTTRGIVVSANGHAARLLGRQPHELVGDDLADFVQDERDSLAKYLNLCSRTREMMLGSLNFRLSQSEIVSYRCEGALLQTAQDGKPGLLILRATNKEHASARFLVLNEKLDALAKEVLRRTMAEELARSSEERLRFAQAAANLGSWEWNLETNEVWWSDEICALHGYASGAVQPTYAAWLSFVVPEDRERAESVVQETLKYGTQYDVEYRSQCPDGALRWIAARGQVIRNKDGHPVRMVGISLDVTRQKLAEETLRKAEKLTAAGRMAATIAHEINNPLEAVTNLLYLLRTNQSLNDEGRHFLATAEQELQRVAHITRQTLGFYRDTTVPVSLNLCRSVSEVLSVYQRKIDAKSIQVEIEGEEIDIVAVPGEIRQIVSNLVLNAIDAVPIHGKLRIQVRPSREWNNGKLSGARLVIADNGCGISANHRAKLFEPFHTTKRDVGTGLGLWVSKQLVEKHGGSIRYRSSACPPRTGTVFSVFLPCVSNLPASDDATKKQSIAAS